jgi:hypothetical protein
MSSSEEDDESEYDSEEEDSSEDDSSSYDDSGDSEDAISKEEQERAMEELKKKQKEDEERLAEAARKQEELNAQEKAKLGLKGRLHAVEDIFHTHQVFNEDRKKNNEEAISTFKNTYRLCCEGKQGERIEKYLPKSEHKPQRFLPALKTYIDGCEKFKHCILDGELSLIDNLPPWHCIAFLDSLMMAGGTRTHISIQMPKRKLTIGEMQKVCDIVQSRQKIQKLSLSNSEGWDDSVEDEDEAGEEQLKMYDLLFDELLYNKEEDSHDLRELDLEYTMPNDHDAEKFWGLATELLAGHETMTAFRIAFCRRNIVVSTKLP